jgi:hypothetical protein
MQRFYSLLQSHSWRSKYILPSIGIRTACHCLVLCFLVFITAIAHAQQVTFYESFDEADEGDLPEGWTSWQNGGGAAPIHWSVWKYNQFGVEKYVISDAEPGREGMTDEDWLITPQITPVAGDFLMFNTRRSVFFTGDMFYIRISTTTNKAPDAFTKTLATFTEEDLPEFVDPVNGKIRVDLSAYAGIPIYISFVHVANVGPEAISGIWFMDDVEVRPKQGAYIDDTFFRQATSPPQPPVKLGDVAFPGTLEFVVNGDYGNVDISSITFTTQGTTDISLIKEVKVYYTTDEYVVIEDIIAGLVPLFGSLENPSETFEVTGNIAMELGSVHFFWIVYVLDDSRQLVFPYPQIDMTFEKYIANGQEYTPSVTTYFGAIDVVPPDVINDNFADAIQITPIVSRYGSSTYPATYEEDHDILAYCQNTGFEEIHSVWWYFIAPGNGLITADLSESRFNTIVAFFDENMSQVACNDDINDNQEQSIISEYPVTAGQKIYVRVSDIGGFGGTSYHDAGVVIMDFTFTTPVGVEDDFQAIRVSVPYPNPARTNASFDLEVYKPGEVTIDIQNMVGKKVLTQRERYAAGKHTVTLDASALTPGAYLIRVAGHGMDTTRKLIVTR